MNEPTDNHPTPQPPVRLPSRRAAALLAAATLGIGVALGAAIGPAPQASLGASESVAKQLPLLLARIAQARAAAAAATAAAQSAEPPAVTPTATPSAAKHKRVGKTGEAEAATSGGEKEKETETTGKSSPETTGKKLPAIQDVWLIQLAGTGFEAAQSNAAAAPYLTGTLLGQGTLLSKWSAIDAGAFASEAALAEPPAAGATPPTLRSIVEPPCPEGAPGASCATETGQLTAADEWLKATLATITSTAAYKEHGLVVITFAEVGVATQSELPAGSSTATLDYTPPAGVLLLSPFAKAGAKPSAAFDTTSPRRSLETLLH